MDKIIVNGWCDIWSIALKKCLFISGHRYKIKHLYIMGLATDYCVKFTVLDAVQLGYQVTVIQDGCRGVNLHPEDSHNALQEMVLAGAKLITSSDLLTQSMIVTNALS